jgi:hypothetical protein
MTKPLMLGCDPGKEGGIALLYSDGTAETHRMPATETDMVELARELADRWDRSEHLPQATIEFVRSSPQMGVVSAFTFGRNYATLRTALIAAGFVLHEVTPPKWQRVLGISARGDKNALKARAQELFPTLLTGEKVVLWNADALLIASYGAKECGR